MSNQYPRHLFRHPGPYGDGARSYGLIAAADKDEEKALKAKGWFASKEEAWNAAKPADEPPAIAGQDDAKVKALEADLKAANELLEEEQAAHKATKADLDAALEKLASFDHDGDGSPGGSKKTLKVKS